MYSCIILMGIFLHSKSFSSSEVKLKFSPNKCCLTVMLITFETTLKNCFKKFKLVKIFVVVSLTQMERGLICSCSFHFCL